MCMAGMGSLLSAGVSGLSAIASYNAQVEDFNRKEQQWKENYVNSLSAGRDEYNQLIARGVQEQQQTSQKLSQYTTEQAIKEAQAEVSASSAGVAGNTVDDLIRDIGRGAATNRYYAAENGKNTALQLTQEFKGAESRVQNRINSVTRPQAPSPAGAMLSIIGGFAGAVGSM